MTLGRLLADLMTEKPHQYPAETVTKWLNEVEGMAVEKVFNRTEGTEIGFEGYDYAKDYETQLLIPDRFSDVYVNYLASKIDYANREFGGYNNSTAMFNAAWDEFSAAWRRTHKPKPLAGMRNL